MHFCALFILDFYGEAQSNDPLPVTVAVMLVLAAFFVTIIYGFARYFLVVRKKPFKFFLCHHKSGASGKIFWRRFSIRGRRKNNYPSFFPRSPW